MDWLDDGSHRVDRVDCLESLVRRCSPFRNSSPLAPLHHRRLHFFPLSQMHKHAEEREAVTHLNLSRRPHRRHRRRHLHLVQVKRRFHFSCPILDISAPHL